MLTVRSWGSSIESCREKLILKQLSKYNMCKEFTFIVWSSASHLPPAFIFHHSTNWVVRPSYWSTLFEVKIFCICFFYNGGLIASLRQAASSKLVLWHQLASSLIHFHYTSIIFCRYNSNEGGNKSELLKDKWSNKFLNHNFSDFYLFPIWK